MLKKHNTGSKNQTEIHAATDYKSVLNELKIYSKMYNISTIMPLSQWLFLL